MINAVAVVKKLLLNFWMKQYCYVAQTVMRLEAKVGFSISNMREKT
jgi:hypothetical protein